MKSLTGSLIGLMLSVCVCTASETEQHYSPQELEAAKAQLREHNRLWTFEEGAILGREWTSRAPEDAELRALYARQLEGQLDGRREIQEQADAILEREPDNPWGLYAQALAFLTDWQHFGEAAESSLRAWRLLPRPEFAATYLQALRFRNTEAGMAFLDSVDAATLHHPEVLHARAELEYRAQYSLNNPAYADTSLATLAALRMRWPDHVSGYLSAAQQLHRSDKPQEALPLIEEAIRLSPSSADVRYLHWQILNETDQLPADERRAAIEASIAAYRQAVPETVRGLALLTTAYRNVLEDEEQAAAFEAKLLAQAPASQHASRIHQGKFEREYQRLQSELERIVRRDAPEYQNRLRLICDAAYRFLENPLYDDSFRERPYRALLSSLSAMKPIPAEELAEAVRGLVRYEQQPNPYVTYGALILMTDRTPYAEEAAELARGVIQAMLDRAEEEALEGGSAELLLGLRPRRPRVGTLQSGSRRGRPQRDRAGTEVLAEKHPCALSLRPDVRAHGDRGRGSGGSRHLARQGGGCLSRWPRSPKLGTQPLPSGPSRAVRAPARLARRIRRVSRHTPRRGRSPSDSLNAQDRPPPRTNPC